MIFGSRSPLDQYFGRLREVFEDIPSASGDTRIGGGPHLLCKWPMEVVKEPAAEDTVPADYAPLSRVVDGAQGRDVCLEL